jgi:RecA/RadA recombinase
MPEDKKDAGAASIISDIAKQFTDDVSIISNVGVKDWISSCNYALNKAISGDYFKGYPAGRIVEFFGETSSGKSMFLYYAILGWQNKYKDHAYTILDDTENSATYDVLHDLIGVDCSRVLVVNSLSVEDHFENVWLGIKDDKGKTKKVSLVDAILEADPEARIMVALDSVAQLSSRHEMETNFGTRDMTKAYMMGKGLRQVDKHYIAKYNILYLVVNQLRDKIGGYGGKTTTSGNSLPYATHLRIETSIAGRIKVKHSTVDEEEVVGDSIKFFVKKSKVAPPLGQCTIDYVYRSNDKYPVGMRSVSGVEEALEKDGVPFANGRIERADGKSVWMKDFTDSDFLVLVEKIAKNAKKDKKVKYEDKI